MLAGKHLVEHDAEREEIGPCIDGVSAELFRRHVGRSPDNAASLGEATFPRRGFTVVFRVLQNRLRNAEVHDLDVAIPAQHDVSRLQIPVNDVALVSLVERFGHLVRGSQALL